MMNRAQTAGKIAVLLSTYNGSKYLRQQLDSLYGQTHPEIRIWVRDDGSSDSTQAMLEGEQAQGRLTLLGGGNNLGPAQSFFKLLKNAAATEADYVAFCDQDDVWDTDKVERAISMLARVPADIPAMYCSRLELVDENLCHLAYTETPRKIGFGNALVESVAVGCTMVLNRKAVDLIASNLPDRVVIHDWWCYLVVSCLGEVVFDKSAPIKYRQHETNTIGVGAGWLARLSRKWHRFFGAGDGRRWMSGQAAVFQARFQDAIPLPDRQCLDAFVRAKSSLRLRLQLAMSGDVWRQKRADDVLLRLLILMNRY